MSKSHAPVNPLTPNQSGRKESSVNNSKAGVKETCWDWGYLGVTPHPFQTKRKVEPRRKKALESKLPTISPTHTNSHYTNPYGRGQNNSHNIKLYLIFIIIASKMEKFSRKMHLCE